MSGNHEISNIVEVTLEPVPRLGIRPIKNTTLRWSPSQLCRVEESVKPFAPSEVVDVLVATITSSISPTRKLGDERDLVPAKPAEVYSTILVSELDRCIHYLIDWVQSNCIDSVNWRRR